MVWLWANMITVKIVPSYLHHRHRRHNSQCHTRAHTRLTCNGGDYRGAVTECARELFLIDRADFFSLVNLALLGTLV